MEREEIILTGQYKDFRADRHYDMAHAAAEQVVAVLIELSDLIEPWVYQYSGIDTANIERLVDVGSGLPAVTEFLASFKRDALMDAARQKKTMLPIAESYLLRCLLQKAGVAIKPRGDAAPDPGVEEPADQIVFVGNCRGWFSVKKLTVDAATPEWEVAGILSTINHTLVNKAFDFAGRNDPIGGGGRKSLGNLAQALRGLATSDAYSICKTCESFGYKPYAAPEMLMDEYPDIKPPKVKGRKPKS